MKRFLFFFLILQSLLFFLSQPSSHAQPTKKEITLEDLWKNRTFQQKTVSGVRSMKDGIHYTTLTHEEGSSYIIQYGYKTGKVVDTILKSDWLIVKKDTLSIDDYQFSSDESQLLIATETERIYRHSTRETNYIWHLKEKKLMLLSDGPKQRYAKFSPTGSKVAFVRGNNLFVTDLNTLPTDQAGGKETQITSDGKYNHIINGATDWVYEEEFGFDKAFFWSPEGSKIAYYRFDESEVKEFSMAMYGTLYPENYKFKYPKTGEDNAKVSIHIFDLKSKDILDIELGKNFEYIPKISWTKDPKLLSIQRMNRHQDKLELILANATNGETKVTLTKTSDTYVDIAGNPTFLDNKKTLYLDK